jgi:hypothetical protein
MTNDFFVDLDWCMEHRRPHALLIPWVNRDSRESIDAAESGLIARGWVANAELDRFERGGWYVWFRSQGTGAAPIAQFNRIAPWGDEIDGWGPAHIGFIDDSLTCPDCGDYTDGGLCTGCRFNERVRTQLTLF